MLKRIALHVEKDQARYARYAAALALARRFQAQVVGVYVSHAWMPDQAEHDIFPSAVYELMLEQQAQERRLCEAEFNRHATQAEVDRQWRAALGRPADALALHARCTDLLVLSQADATTDSIVDPYSVETVIMTAGRPVLVVPYAAEYTSIGDRILVCWDGGREAARALADAAPFLARARNIFALTLGSRSANLQPGEMSEALQAWLRPRGYAEPRLLARDTDGRGMGDAILTAAADHGCDLIVMGLYGHNRAREWVLGGASRDMLRNMTVPVLFSH
ncbi:universal stress protein [Bordetella bronchialis]|uniref:UspA domain-containing protein n=1 Tax=Bordetella bronchialis TaxID=463025 RepID=A0A193FYM7_9BORD|nr:universal stress protein [Bordetella bronchialis]ANN72291.1 hypothetical protein BAU08_13895 [Bordetella bronchialis]